jgi:hypothetical protein
MDSSGGFGGSLTEGRRENALMTFCRSIMPPAVAGQFCRTPQTVSRLTHDGRGASSLCQLVRSVVLESVGFVDLQVNVRGVPRGIQYEASLTISSPIILSMAWSAEVLREQSSSSSHSSIRSSTGITVSWGSKRRKQPTHS